MCFQLKTNSVKQLCYLTKTNNTRKYHTDNKVSNLLYKKRSVPNDSPYVDKKMPKTKAITSTWGWVESSVQFICSFLSQGNVSRQTLVWSVGLQRGGPVPRPFVFVPVQECKTIIILFGISRNVPWEPSVRNQQKIFISFSVCGL